jgi:type IV secretion system protein VirB9
MKVLIAFCLGLSALLAPPTAFAAEAPKPGLTDPRIRSLHYDEEQVVTLIGYLGYQMMVEFGSDERIENVSVGDSLGWQITPNHKANLLFLKPMGLAPATNMTVVTDRRRYAFELRTARTAGVPQTEIAYVVRFLYPPDPTPVPVTVVPPPPPPPEKVNTAYSYTGSRATLPSQVFDDGRFTYFKWPDTTTTPALFLIEPDGSESIVNYTMRDGYQVVEQLAPRFKLRDGKEITVVINDHWLEPTPGDLAPRPHDAKTARESQVRR